MLGTAKLPLEFDAVRGFRGIRRNGMNLIKKGVANEPSMGFESPAAGSSTSSAHSQRHDIGFLMLAPLFMGRRRPRVALIASTPRSREYGRRALRLLGCVPLIFLDMAEFLEMGSRSRELSMVFLEHPDDDADETATAPALGDSVREIVGEDLPILHSFPAQSGGAIPGFRANDMLLPASLSFAQLCRTLRGFLQKHDLPTRDAHLEWGVHRFCIESGMVYVNGAAVPLKPEEFDLALELFFNAGARVSRPWLRTMIPALQTLRRRPTAPAADASVLRLREMLGLQATHGWDLQVNPGLSCTLVRADCMT